MQTIEATYQVNTPMFLGGASQQAELRLPSFKGALRFWWRALAWDRIKNPEELLKEESELFGSSDREYGQSKVLMKIKWEGKKPSIFEKGEQLSDGSELIGHGARYFGYGAINAYESKKTGTKDAQLIRSCLDAPASFHVSLILRKTKDDEQDKRRKKQLLDTLMLIGILGGLGSKSRKGYGSLTLLSLCVIPESVN